MTRNSSRQPGWDFCVAVLVSSFLVFQVQPLISKFILPWFGGTPGVWSACMLFFQSLLFLGYAYAHFSIRYWSAGRQVAVHAVLLLVAAATLPFAPDVAWKPNGSESPIGRILGMLTMSVGLPYFVLASNSPLLQAWLRKANPEATPYRLYALSNVGSLVGLLSYPFVFEPLMTNETQAKFWSAGFGLFAVSCLWCGWRAFRATRLSEEGSGVLISVLASPTEPTVDSRTDSQRTSMTIERPKQKSEHLTPARATSDQQPDASAFRLMSPNDEPAPTWLDKSLWFGLSACASTMLLAITNQVCLDVAVIPFLWVIPLSLYLLTLILVFDHERWYPRHGFVMALAVVVTCVTLVLYQGSGLPILVQLAVHFGALFVCCMVCHGELAKLKPNPRHLTSFYLAMAAGGAAGGVGVGLLAPMIFERLLELQLGLVACAVCVLAVLYRERPYLNKYGRPIWAWTAVVVSSLGLLRSYAGETHKDELATSQNFFGVLRVLRENKHDPDHAEIQLVHGRTIHGRQFVSPEKRRWPTAYYGESSGVGLALRNSTRATNRRCGFVGLGVGTLATYGRPSDTFRYYEIDPDVLRLAREQFTFLSDSSARQEFVLGDARLMLEAEPPQAFDLLVLDAFSSDSIPVHLLTREAFAIYRRHLRDDGVIAIHVSNHHLDLEPVVRRLAEEMHWPAAKIISSVNADLAQYEAHWMLLSRNASFWETPEISSAMGDTLTHKAPPTSPLWTDQFSNLLDVLK